MVLLSQNVEQLYLDELLGDGCGAVGYRLKDRVFDDVTFAGALRTVAAGGTVVDPEVIASLMQKRSLRSRLDRLTPRPPVGEERPAEPATACSYAAGGGAEGDTPTATPTPTVTTTPRATTTPTVTTTPTITTTPELTPTVPGSSTSPPTWNPGRPQLPSTGN